MTVELKKCRALPENEWRLLSGLYVSAFPAEERRDNQGRGTCGIPDLLGFRGFLLFGAFCRFRADEGRRHRRGGLGYFERAIAKTACAGSRTRRRGHDDRAPGCVLRTQRFRCVACRIRAAGLPRQRRRYAVMDNVHRNPAA